MTPMLQCSKPQVSCINLEPTVVSTVLPLTCRSAEKQKFHVDRLGQIRYAHAIVHISHVAGAENNRPSKRNEYLECESRLIRSRILTLRSRAGLQVELKLAVPAALCIVL